MKFWRSLNSSVLISAKRNVMCAVKPLQVPKMTELPNGLLVSTLETPSAVSEIGIYYIGGSRFETEWNLGVTHAIRSCAGLSGKKLSQFGIQRNLQQMGANLVCSTGREHMTHKLRCLSHSLTKGLEYMKEVTVNSAFHPWEVAENVPRMALDLSLMKPEMQLMEMLHKVAFRTQLGNSLYSRKDFLGKHNSSMLHEFVRQHFITNCAAVVGVGVDHGKLVEFANSLSLESGPRPKFNPCLYKGGEIRMDRRGDIAYVAVAVEGVSYAYPEQLMNVAVLQQIMGGAPGKGENYHFRSRNKLTEALKPEYKDQVEISAFNLSYSESGLFGFLASGPSEIMNQVVKAGIHALFNIKITEKDVTRAKTQLKAAILNTESIKHKALEELGLQLLLHGKIMETKLLLKLVDKITAKDLTSVPTKFGEGKMSMAALGNLSHVPYLDDITQDLFESRT